MFCLYLQKMTQSRQTPSCMRTTLSYSTGFSPDLRLTSNIVQFIILFCNQLKLRLYTFLIIDSKTHKSFKNMLYLQLLSWISFLFMYIPLNLNIKTPACITLIIFKHIPQLWKISPQNLTFFIFTVSESVWFNFKVGNVLQKFFLVFLVWKDE